MVVPVFSSLVISRRPCMASINLAKVLMPKPSPQLKVFVLKKGFGYLVNNVVRNPASIIANGHLAIFSGV